MKIRIPISTIRYLVVGEIAPYYDPTRKVVPNTFKDFNAFLMVR